MLDTFLGISYGNIYVCIYIYIDITIHDIILHTYIYFTYHIISYHIISIKLHSFNERIMINHGKFGLVSDRNAYGFVQHVGTTNSNTHTHT